MTLKFMDVYFSRAYASCYSEVEKAEVCEYRHYSALGEVFYVFLKRKIDSDRLDGYYDIITPYGYGGPVICKTPSESTEELVRTFSDEFTQYCTENNIVSEFVRFHPLANNHIYFKEHYSPEFNRKTVCVNLTEKDAMSTVTARCRRASRDAVKKGVEIIFDFSGKYLDDFHRIYLQTMDKNHASQYYHFDKQFFKGMCSKLRDQVFFVHALFDNKVVASVMFLCFYDYIHYHLLGTDPEFYHLNANTLILTSVIQWGIEQGKIAIHLGGGYTNAEDDSLLVFKKSFTKEELYDFYIGKKIYNQEIYDKLCEEKNIDKTSAFFPLYLS